MRYTVIIQKLAQTHIQKIVQSGDKNTIKKLKKILLELESNPTIGSGNPELLKHSLSGLWSRRLNKKDRLIYEVFEEPEELVVVIAALGHY